MKTTLLNAKQIGEQLGRLMEAFDKFYDKFYWAIAWDSSQGPLAQQLLDDKKKIRKLIIGTALSHTDPYLLRALRDCPGAKRYPDSNSGIFHPKIYYFQSETGAAAAIVASANFTGGGTDRNIEAALFFEGNAGDELFRQIRQHRLEEQSGTEQSPGVRANDPES